MFHEAQEWKWVQTFHGLMVATAIHALVWSFKNNLWLIILWPHCCTLRSPVRLFVRYPDKCLTGLRSDSLWFVPICTVVCPVLYCSEWLLKCQGGLSGAVQWTPQGGTAQSHGDKKGRKMVASVTFPFILCQTYYIFGEEVRLAIMNILCFTIIFYIVLLIFSEIF